MDFETIRAMALENGFSYAAPMDCALLELRQEVRDMCAANTCGMYGKNLACPPACGTIEEAVSRAYERARPDGMACCLGSLYMAGAARAAAGRLKRCV